MAEPNDKVSVITVFRDTPYEMTAEEADWLRGKGLLREQPAEGSEQAAEGSTPAPGVPPATPAAVPDPPQASKPSARPASTAKENT